MNYDNDDINSLDKKLKAFYKEWDNMADDDRHEMIVTIKKQLHFANELLKLTHPASFNEKDRLEIAAKFKEVKARLDDLNCALASRRNSYLCRMKENSYN